jgi:geranylgeranyl diphosphate synthase, type II
LFHLALSTVTIQTPSLPQNTAELRQRIDAALLAHTDLPVGCPGKLREAIRYSLLAPGKRLRPLLVLWAAEACGGTLEAALPAACAVEMVHAYSLVHDDLPAMDNDDLRRGLPTCHRKFGEATAILAGDALLALAFETLAAGVRPPAVAAACCCTLAKAAGPCHLVGGQCDDIERGEPSGTTWEGVLPSCGTTFQVVLPDDDPTDCKSVLPSCETTCKVVLQTLESIHRRKTGALIEASLRLGALVAGVDAWKTDALVQYGRAMGLAFQITDDLLDVRGDQGAVGKRVRKDSDRGTLTFPGLLGLDGSLQRAEELVAEACRALEPLGAEAGNLEGLARYVLERNR